MSDDPLDRKGLFFVVDWDKRTLGQRHDKLRGAVKEYNETLKAMKPDEEYYVSVVELTYPTHNLNGLPSYCETRRFTTLRPELK